MASLNRLSYFSAMTASSDDGDIEEGLGYGDDGAVDGRTPLDKTIDRIGMGWYQWTLLSLCGFGWLADNMWIQAIAIVLPRVQQHFSVSDAYIGTLSSSMFAGMMFGAVGWGACSDLIGRKAAFNATLFLTSVFGVLASFANTFVLLCVALFFLGSAVGGSMPTDGTLLLEHMPNGKQYLVTALSVFFSFGSVLSAVVGLLVIPGHSCPPAPAPCDVSSQNSGWKYLLSALGIITLSMFLARIVFFRLHESPRYLVHAGRQQEALESLQLIARFNGDDLDLGLEDVQDHAPAAVLGDGISASPTRITHDAESAFGNPDQDSSALVFDADSADGDVAEVARRSLSSARSRDMLRSAPESDSKNYDAMGESNVPLNGHQYDTLPRRGSTYHVDSSRMHDETDEAKEPLVADPVPPSPTEQRTPRLRPGYQERISQRMSTTSSMYEARSKLYWKLPRRVRKPVWAFVDRIAMVLSPEWMRTTLLVWAAWFAMSLAYTMFNVYLPKLLEGRGASDITATTQNSLEDSLWDVVIYAVGGCPGAILGAYLIESPLGRRWSLAGSTFVTAFFCVIFVWVEQSWAVRASTVGIGLSATAMWAVLYGWTPEMFGTKVRGSACGIASALSRIGGMIAPMLGGALLSINNSVPVYASIVIFVLAGLCVLLLHEEKKERSAGRALMH